MSNKITLAALAAAAVVGIASPAFSQAFNPGYGGGNVQPFFYAPTSENSARVQVRATRTHAFTTGALRAFASEAPQPDYSFGSVSPSATGGGSVGYNEHLYEAD